MPQLAIKIPLAYKVYRIVFISVLFCGIVISVYNYYESREMLGENIGTGLKKIAQTATLNIDGSSLKTGTIRKSSIERSIKQYLQKVKRQNAIKEPLYILRKVGSKNAMLVLSTEPGYLSGAEYRTNPTMEKVFSTGVSDFSPIYTDQSGAWISAYAPVRDRTGLMVGILEINQEIGHYMKQLRITLVRIILLCIAACLFGLLLGIRLLNPILGALNTLSIAAHEMQEHKYGHSLAEVDSNDEIGHLATTMEAMRISINEYTNRLRESWMNQKQAHLESIKTLSEAIAIREPYTKGHIERVSRCAAEIARELGLSREDIDTLHYGCVLHDVGKIGVNIDIINKPARLSAEEYEKIKEHPHLGAKIVRGVKFLEKAKDIILYHQERFDGTGYPSGLKGEAIPILARIVALADAYDAMASDRPYRSRLSDDEIVSIIQKEAGSQFDPTVVNAFLAAREKKKKQK